MTDKEMDKELNKLWKTLKLDELWEAHLETDGAKRHTATFVADAVLEGTTPSAYAIANYRRCKQEAAQAEKDYYDAYNVYTGKAWKLQADNWQADLPKGLSM